MELAYAILARSVDLSSDGSLSALGLDFEKVRSSSFPIAIALHVMAKIDGITSSDEIGTPMVELDVIGPNGISILPTPLIANPVPLAKNFLELEQRNSVRVLMGLNAMTMPSAGKYEVHFSVTIGKSDPRIFKKTIPVTAEIING